MNGQDGEGRELAVQLTQELEEANELIKQLLLALKQLLNRTKHLPMFPHVFDDARAAIRAATK